jgi:hypothetical protein
MAVRQLPLVPGSQARAILHHLLEHSDVIGRDHTGRTLLALFMDDHILDQLAAFDAETEDLEPEPDEEDG